MNNDRFACTVILDYQASPFSTNMNENKRLTLKNKNLHHKETTVCTMWLNCDCINLNRRYSLLFLWSNRDFFGFFRIWINCTRKRFRDVMNIIDINSITNKMTIPFTIICKYNKEKKTTH